VDSMSNITQGLPFHCKKHKKWKQAAVVVRLLGGLSPREGLSVIGGMRSGRQEEGPTTNSQPGAAAFAKPCRRAASLPADRQAG